MSREVLFEKGLPVALDAERFILGSVMLHDDFLAMVAAELEDQDFSLEKHRRIFARMRDVANRGDRVDRVTLADELIKQGQLESVDGLSYLVSLDDGLPEISNIDSYVRIVKEKSTLRKAIFAYQRAIDQCMQAAEPSVEILARSEAATRELSANIGRSGLKPADEVFKAGGGANTFIFPSAGPRRKVVPTPWQGLNDLLRGGGLMPKTMTVIGARPSQGKTSLGCNLASFAASQGVVTPFFTLEMPNEDILEQFAYERAEVDSARHSIGICTKAETDRLSAAYAEIIDNETFPLYLQDSCHTLSAIRSDLIKLAAKGPIGLIVIDYVQLIQSMGNGRENRNMELTVISAGLKRMFKDFDCPGVVLAQLNREMEKTGRRPMPSDMRDCGAIEQDADIILMPYELPRDVQSHDWQVEPFVDLIVAKQRRGAKGSVRMQFRKQFTRFEEMGR